MRRLWPLVLLLASFVTPAAAQSLGEVAARTNKERKGTGGKVYTNDDLAEGRSAAERPAAASTGAAATPPPATMDPAVRWRRDAKARRDAITRAETKAAAAQAKLDALLSDRNPTNVMDPNRLQTLEAERAKAMAELEAAKDEITQAKQALEDFEEEARKAGVPPGWLREP
jgi:hypothetical protein